MQNQKLTYIDKKRKYVNAYKNSKIEYLKIKDLTKSEIKVINKTNKIIKMIDGLPPNVKAIKIFDMDNTFLSKWIRDQRTIAINRTCLSSVDNYVNALLPVIIEAKREHEDFIHNYEHYFKEMLRISIVNAVQT